MRYDNNFKGEKKLYIINEVKLSVWFLYIKHIYLKY